MVSALAEKHSTPCSCQRGGAGTGGEQAGPANVLGPCKAVLLLKAMSCLFTPSEKEQAVLFPPTFQPVIGRKVVNTISVPRIFISSPSSYSSDLPCEPRSFVCRSRASLRHTAGGRAGQASAGAAPEEAQPPCGPVSALLVVAPLSSTCLNLLAHCEVTHASLPPLSGVASPPSLSTRCLILLPTVRASFFRCIFFSYFLSLVLRKISLF